MSFLKSILVVTLVPAFYGANAQIFPSSTNMQASIQASSAASSISSSLASVAAATSTWSTISYPPSSVPFNTGPDPFPIVLPSTFTLTSDPFSTTTGQSTISTHASKDPYSISDPNAVQSVAPEVSDPPTSATETSGDPDISSTFSDAGTLTPTASSGAEEATNQPGITKSGGGPVMQLGKCTRQALMAGVVVASILFGILI